MLNTHLSNQFDGYCRTLPMFNIRCAHDCVYIGFEATHFGSLVNAELAGIINCTMGEDILCSDSLHRDPVTPIVQDQPNIASRTVV